MKVEKRRGGGEGEAITVSEATFTSGKERHRVHWKALSKGEKGNYIGWKVILGYDLWVSPINSLFKVLQVPHRKFWCSWQLLLDHF